MFNECCKIVAKSGKQLISLIHCVVFGTRGMYEGSMRPRSSTKYFRAFISAGFNHLNHKHYHAKITKIHASMIEELRNQAIAMGMNLCIR